MATAGDIIRKPCLQCGAEFEFVVKRCRPKLHCSDKCRQAHRSPKPPGYRSPNAKTPKKHLPQTPCEFCHKPTSRPRFCSQLCSCNARVRRLGVRPADVAKAERRKAAERACKECGQLFVRSSGTNAGLYCSRPCAYAERRRNIPTTEAKRRAERDAAEHQRNVVRAARALVAFAVHMVRMLKPCAMCGGDRGKPNGYGSYCGPCAAKRARELNRKHPNRKKWRRIAKARRRAVERGLEADRFDPIEIFERDGWRCHICHRKTPKKLRGTYDDRAPELDHIISLAGGGTHTRQNTACSCRKCNIEKGAKSYGQLRLVA